MNKLTLQALALTGILAVSGLPAFAADMTAPASPAPSASVSTDSKAKVATPSTSSVDNKAKTAIDKNKTAATKNVDKTSKTVAKDKKTVKQTASKPAVNTSAGASTSTSDPNRIRSPCAWRTDSIGITVRTQPSSSGSPAFSRADDRGRDQVQEAAHPRG